jgi:hypothetical protein
MKNLLITRHSKNSGENCAKCSGPSFHGKLALDGWGKCRNPLKIIANAEIHSNSQNYIIVILVVTPPCSKNTVVLARDAAFEMEAMSDILVVWRHGDYMLSRLLRC